ncbi:hypothetical protein DPMN_098911 [Dreissena polymorpha]|uniref:Endonuclease/exonuclease/phosphatase domain-containing protein n=1 Tax=Dreissena polymorpha TaxID=45954 RepID=A0A9D4LD37_DREPO|nr:hypothetical protein DPMN_098911 [Dreissena polymorpha]
MNFKLVTFLQNPVNQRLSNLIKLALLNTRSFHRQFKDIISEPESSADVLCVNETWMKQQPTPDMTNRTSYRQDRKHRQAGGDLCYISTKFTSQCFLRATYNDIDILHVMLSIRGPVHIILVYFAPNGSTAHCKDIIYNAILNIPDTDRIFILGDFNKVVLNGQKFCTFRTLIPSPTCKTGSALDMVFYNRHDQVMTHIQPVYFSYYSVIWVGVQF